jgi:hypothetical protein
MRSTRLDIGARHTEAGQGDEVALLALGWAITPEACFFHDPPTPGELERAIEVVEDEVMRTRHAGASDPELQAGGEALLAVIEAAGGADGLSLDAVERLFQRIAAESLGNPAARHGLPAGNHFVATLLILREFMHHQGFASVRFAATAVPYAVGGTDGGRLIPSRVQ